MRDFGDSAERWRLASEAAQLGVWCRELRENRLVCTPPYRTIFGLDPDEEPSPARWMSMVHADDRPAVLAAVDRAVATRGDYRAEYRIVRPDGSVCWVASVGRFYPDTRTEDARLLGVVLDVTSRKQAEQELLEQARAVTRAKDEILAVVSHELRTPIQAMLGWTELLKSHPGDPAFLGKALTAIERNARAQAQLVEDLLDLSRIAGGRLRVERARVDLAMVVDAALDAPRIAADAKSVRLEARIDPQVGAVLGDAQRLQQVVSNLVSNAVKFTPGGRRVQVTLERDGASARLVVADEGCGIPPDFLPHVFERFRQADGGATRRQGGLGLGLAIARHLVDEHGGTLRAESPGEGRGATFTVTLPLLAAA
jgi:PAS domain S-box-containing protein